MTNKDIKDELAFPFHTSTLTTLTKRELVTAMVLQGLSANEEFYKIAKKKLRPHEMCDFYSDVAIEQADNMLEKLSGKDKTE